MREAPDEDEVPREAVGQHAAGDDDERLDTLPHGEHDPKRGGGGEVEDGERERDPCDPVADRGDRRRRGRAAGSRAPGARRGARRRALPRPEPSREARAAIPGTGSVAGCCTAPTSPRPEASRTRSTAPRSSAARHPGLHAEPAHVEADGAHRGAGRAVPRRREEVRVQSVVCHALYLVNLASPDREIHEKSVAAMRASLETAAAIGAEGVVFHVGSHLGAGLDEGPRARRPARSRAPRADGRPTLARARELRRSRRDDRPVGRRARARSSSGSTAIRDSGSASTLATGGFPAST